MIGNKLQFFWRRRFPRLVEFVRQKKAKKWPKGSIVYYIGSRKQPLIPEVLGSGASGSYTAVIKLSQEWVKLGYQVTVYSTCEGKAGVYDGVNYLDYHQFNPYDQFDILIIFQHPYLLQLPVKARKVCFDWHDILGEARIFPWEKINRFDLIFAKSRFQRSLMPQLQDEKFVIVTNAVDAELFASNLRCTAKQPYRLIYASRYYRGLEYMLTYGWPLIHQAIPQAELHIYYGFVRSELTPEMTLWREKMQQLLQQPGIVHQGKVAQKTLILDKSISSIHYYGCTYPEIDCISVRESAMVGCVPVTTDHAVFKEKNYCVKVPGKPELPATQVAVAMKIVELLQNPNSLSDLSQQFAENAKHETWDNVAKVWTNSWK